MLGILIVTQAENTPTTATVGINITQQNPTLKLLTTQFEMNSKHSKRRSDQVIKMSSTSFHTSSSVKNMKSTADAGNDVAVCARVRCNAQFATVSFCERRFFKHFNFKFWRMILYTEEWRILVSHEIWRVVLWLFGAPSWLKIRLLPESTLSSVPTASPLPWCLIVLPVFLNFLNNLFRPKTVQPSPENSVISFCTIFLQLVQIFN